MRRVLHCAAASRMAFLVGASAARSSTSVATPGDELRPTAEHLLATLPNSKLAEACAALTKLHSELRLAKTDDGVGASTASGDANPPLRLRRNGNLGIRFRDYQRAQKGARESVVVKDYAGIDSVSFERVVGMLSKSSARK